MSESILIAAIRIDERRRKALGDIAGLARSIDRYGLLHPITVEGPDATNTYRLLAGHRRLLACQFLGWREIDARLKADLSEAERREIELAENLDRKDLTAAERSRDMVALAETAAEVDREELRSTVGRNARGRPEEKGSLRRVSERTGIPTTTLHRAKEHVAAIDAYPELAPYPQAGALKIAAELDAMPEGAREEARVLIREQATDLGSQPNKTRKRKEAPRLGLKPGNGKHDWSALERERMKSEALAAAANACTTIGDAHAHVVALIETRKAFYGGADETTSDADLDQWRRAVGLAEGIVNAITIAIPAVAAADPRGAGVR